MNADQTRWLQRYQRALRVYLKQAPSESLQSAFRLGRQAVALQLETLDLARLHKQAMAGIRLPGEAPGFSRAMIKKASRFFAGTVVPIEETHLAAVKAEVRVSQLIRTLRQRTKQAAVSTRCLNRSILLRQNAKKALEKSEQRHGLRLVELRSMQKQMQHVTRACLSTHEDTRQKMSLTLQDEIAQTLIAINLRLLALKKAATSSIMVLKKEIANTQRLVRASTRTINRFSNDFNIKEQA
jgi:signal transduction histidine kinase